MGINDAVWQDIPQFLKKNEAALELIAINHIDEAARNVCELCKAGKYGTALIEAERISDLIRNNREALEKAGWL